MTILLVMEATDGGTGRYLEEVSRELVKALDLHIVCSARRNPDFRRVMQDLRRNGIRVIELDMVREIRPLQDLLAAVRLWRIFRRSKPDVIHLHSSKAGALGRIAATLARAGPVAYTPHAYAFLDESRYWRSRFLLLLERLLAPLTDRLIAVSESERRVSIRHGLSPASRVTVVQNGIEDTMLDRILGSPRGSRRPEDPIRLGALGRLERQKGPLRLLEMASRLRRLGVDFTLDIVGRGSLEAECRKAQCALDLQDRVKFVGCVDDVSGFYRSLDIFVTTSAYEGLPYAVMDAMAWRLPVVGFDVVGVNDLVVDKVTGLLAPPFMIDRLARGVASLASDEDARLSMGVRARERITHSHRLSQQVDRLLAAYRSLAGHEDGDSPPTVSEPTRSSRTSVNS